MRRLAERELFCQKKFSAPEAIRELVVEDFPVIVVVDSQGNNLYETSIEKWRREE